ncbi:MAG: hypothetical protein WC729_02100 [Sphingomonas sp.]|uniref:hypothetical protein n=1 Tax=Sphingomonas sp. TaxID=28214 RepID=UPI003569F84C
MEARSARAATIVGAGAAFLCLAALVLWWPGVVEYDSVEQYRQVLSGVYLDWHPPIMARFWAVLHLLGPGAAPMFVVQIALYWLGLGLLAAALARSGRVRAGVAVLVIGALPLFAGWQAAVLKDTQMLGALLAAVGLVGWWRLAEKRIPIPAIAAVCLLMAYATLVRANAVFAIVPLVVMLVPWPMRLWQRGLAIVAGVLAVLAVTPPINHGLLGAEETKVTRTLPIFDLAGIAHFSATADGLSPADRALIERHHCYQPYFWDPLGDDRRCGSIAERLDLVPARTLVTLWLGAALHHPIAYLEHRLAHLNSTDRLLVPLGRPDAAPPRRSEPNDLGLVSPSPAASAIARAGGWLVETPLGWPIAWIVVAATGLLVALGRPKSPPRDLALALAVSALTLEASFAVVSIASDLRYHLWPMMAVALMMVLLVAERPLPRRAMILGGAILIAVVGAGTAARLSLPRSPGTYQGMLG